MSEKTKDTIASVILLVFFGVLALAVLGAIIWGFIENPIAALITLGIFAAVWAVGWASSRLNN